MKFKRILPLSLAMIMVFQSTAFAGVPSSSKNYVANSKNVSSYIEGERTVLTVEEATNKAISNNAKIQQMYDKEKLSEDTLSQLRIDYADTTTWTAAVAASIKLKENQLAYSLNLESIEAMKDNVEISIIGLFTTILNAEESLEIANDSLDLQKRNLEISKLRVSLGLESQVGYETAVNSYEKAVAERDSMITSINEAYISLNSLMGTNLNNKYNLNLELSYEPMENVNLTSYVAKYKQQSVSVKEAENAVEIARLTLDQHRTESDYKYETNDLEKQQKEVSYKQAVENLETTKTAVEEAVVTTYNSIKDLENSRASKILEIENIKKELEVLELKLELGQATQLELDSKKLDLKTQQLALKQIEQNHTTSVMKFNNPNILASV